MSKWIRFEFNGLSGSGITKRWLVITTIEPQTVLGTIAWLSNWRCYCFYPDPKKPTVYEKQCLRDIADFCETQTNEHRAAKQLQSVSGTTRPLLPD